MSNIDPYYTFPYIDQLYFTVAVEIAGMDAVYGDYIQKIVGSFGLQALIDCELLEPCGIVNGRQLYTLCEMG